MNRRTLLAVIGIFATACDQATSPVAPNSPSTEVSAVVGPGGATYSGRATTEGKILLITKKFCDTGPLPPTGGTLSSHGPNLTVPGLSMQLFSCFTKGVNRASHSEADVFHIAINVPGYSIFADVLTSMAKAACGGEGQAPYTIGHSHILRLIVNGQQKAITASPNQTISLPNGYIKVNEQFGFNTPTSAAKTVIALHVYIGGLLGPVADLKFASSHADIECG